MNAARRVVEMSLSVVPGEGVLVVSDGSRRELSTVFEEVIRNVNASPVMISLDDSGPRPVRRLPEVIHEALRRVQAVIVICSVEEGESAMVAELLGQAPLLGLRIAHMVGLSARSLIAGFAADSAWIIDATRSVRMRLRPESTLRFRSISGSSLDVKLGPSYRWTDHAGLIRGGRAESLPAGKLSTTALDVSGLFVADASVGEWFGAAAGLLTTAPVRFEIEKSVCRTVRCNDRTLQRDIESHLRRDPGGDRVGAVLLGTNVGLSRPVGEYLCDTTLPGLHLSFGDNGSDAGGGPMIPKPPFLAASAGGDIDLDAQPLLRSGRYLMA